MSQAVLMFVFAGSHPCEAVLAAADAKGVPVMRRELAPVVHRVVMKVRFGGWTVPGMIVEGERVQGTSAIFSRLDELSPDSPLLFPDATPRGQAVREAEAWGAGAFQDVGRRLIWGHLRRCPAAMRTWADSTPSVISRQVKRRLVRPIAALAATANGATAAQLRGDLAALPNHLDHIDELIAQGVIGTAEPTAADFQIFSSVGLWMVLADLRPWIAVRPCGAAAARFSPRYVDRPGIAAGVLPANWYAPVGDRRRAV